MLNQQFSCNRQKNRKAGLRDDCIIFTIMGYVAIRSKLHCYLLKNKGKLFFRGSRWAGFAAN
jgi:hypothetical protein